jgi:NAD(P)H-flavin reductase
MAFVCGPEIMMRFTAMELHKRGVDNEHIFVSMERNMKCAIGLCGHCQFGSVFVCKDGPVFQYSKIKDMLVKWEI